MELDVAEFIRGCVHCRMVKPTRGRWTSGLASPLPVVFEPFEFMSFDIVTISERAEFPYALVIVDHATRYVIAEPLRTKDAEETAEALYRRVIEVYGPPSVVLSDRGFEADVIAALHKHFGITHVRTSPYHPQTNGATERFNSTLLPYLISLSKADESRWQEFLAAALYCYNTTYQTSIAASPYFLMFGRWPVDTVDRMINEFILHEDVDRTRVDMSQWGHRLAVARHLAQEHLFVAKQQAADRTNQSRRELPFAEGDWVYFKPDQPYRKKLSYRGFGSFKVKRINGNAVDLVALDGSTRRANASDLDVISTKRPYVNNVADQLQRLLTAGSLSTQPVRPVSVPSALGRPLPPPVAANAALGAPLGPPTMAAEMEPTSEPALRPPVPPKDKGELSEVGDLSEFDNHPSLEDLSLDFSDPMDPDAPDLYGSTTDSTDEVGGREPRERRQHTEVKEITVSDMKAELPRSSVGGTARAVIEEVQASPVAARNARADVGGIPVSPVSAHHLTTPTTKWIADRVIDYDKVKGVEWVQVGWEGAADDYSENGWYRLHDDPNFGDDARFSWFEEYQAGNKYGPHNTQYIQRMAQAKLKKCAKADQAVLQRETQFVDRLRASSRLRSRSGQRDQSQSRGGELL